MADLSNLYANKELITQQNVPDNHTLIYGTTPYGPVEEVNGAWTWQIGGPATNGIARMRYQVRANNPDLVPNAVYRIGIKVTPQNSITTRCVDLLLHSGMQFVGESIVIPPQGQTDFLYFDVRIVDPVNWDFSFYWHVGMAGSNSSQWMYFREPSLTALTPILTSNTIGGSFSLGPIPIPVSVEALFGSAEPQSVAVTPRTPVAIEDLSGAAVIQPVVITPRTPVAATPLAGSAALPSVVVTPRTPVTIEDLSVAAALPAIEVTVHHEVTVEESRGVAALPSVTATYTTSIVAEGLRGVATLPATTATQYTPWSNVAAATFATPASLSVASFAVVNRPIWLIITHHHAITPTPFTVSYSGQEIPVVQQHALSINTTPASAALSETTGDQTHKLALRDLQGGSVMSPVTVVTPAIELTPAGFVARTKWPVAPIRSYTARWVDVLLAASPLKPANLTASATGSAITITPHTMVEIEPLAVVADTSVVEVAVTHKLAVASLFVVADPDGTYVGVRGQAVPRTLRAQAKISSPRIDQTHKVIVGALGAVAAPENVAAGPRPKLSVTNSAAVGTAQTVTVWLRPDLTVTAATARAVMADPFIIQNFALDPIDIRAPTVMGEPSATVQQWLTVDSFRCPYNPGSVRVVGSGELLPEGYRPRVVDVTEIVSIADVTGVKSVTDVTEIATIADRTDILTLCSIGD